VETTTSLRELAEILGFSAFCPFPPGWVRVGEEKNKKMIVLKTFLPMKDSRRLKL